MSMRISHYEPAIGLTIHSNRGTFKIWNEIQSIMSSVDEIDALIASLQKQILIDDQEKLSKLPPPAKRFEKELARTGFMIFNPISDLGFYEWKPDLTNHSPFNKASVEEIKGQLNADGEPARLVDTKNIQVPFSFLPLRPQTYVNQYPMSHNEIAGIYVATKIRGLQLDDIDFVFGGSTLSMLATKNESDKMYLVTKIPGTSVGLVVKEDNYDHNFADPGFQYQRLVTGKPMNERAGPCFIEHMQLMQVGEYNVLFIAEVDALRDDEPAEVTCSNPFYWDIKLCLQCISSGSSTLCHGTKYRGPNKSLRGIVNSISIKSLSSLYREEASKLRKAEGPIVQALRDMKEQLENSTRHSGDYEIAFLTNGKLKLLARAGSSKLLPSRDVVDALLA